MYKFALGMIETVGLAAGIEAADTAVKSANIRLLGYELTRGGGLVTIKIAGDVGAVKAAVEAGSMAAAKVNKVWSKHIIPRPHEEIQCLIESTQTVGLYSGIKEEEKKEKQENKEKESEEEQNKETKKEEEKPKEIEVINLKEIKKEESQEEKEKLEEDVCNLCRDPKCPRKKGEARSLCIHNKK